MIFLRLIHIFSAIFWMGSTLVLTLFVEPTADSLGPEGGRFMSRLSGGRFSQAMGLTGVLTILTGLWMYAYHSSGFDPEAMFGSHLLLTLGALAGIASLMMGVLVQGRNAGKLGALGQEIAAQGGPPTPEQAARLQALQNTLRSGGRITAALMILAVIGMVHG